MPPRPPTSWGDLSYVPSGGFFEPPTIPSEEPELEEQQVLVFGQQTVMPAEPVNGFGIPQTAMRTLELMESVSTLEDLMVASKREGWGPKESLTKYAKELQKKGRRVKPPSYPMHKEGQATLFLSPPEGLPTPIMPTIPPPPASSVQIPPVPGSAGGTPSMSNSAPTLFTPAPPNVTNPSGAASASATPAPAGAPTPTIPPPSQNVNQTPSSTTASPQTATNVTPLSSPQKQHKAIPARNRNAGASAPSAGVKRKQSTSNTESDPAPKRASRKRKSGAGS
ncbi:uncharacterized protein SCHCODRAFT_02521858 [Schizophyllum commune H4-8]|nr:uncharacterized protein SCHCODRAFT_02521858 [Schizophyllum commune H4-8]KAI5884970.1 hypothetical protein SCHCODRAFT_02521858 [Schizophyllum commune H4-8]